MEPDRDPEGIEIAYLEWTESIYGRKVLEIGSGNGRSIQRYAETAELVAGVDPDAGKLTDAIRQAHRPLSLSKGDSQPGGLKTPLILAQAEAEDLPFAGEQFESVLLAWSL